MAGDDLTLTAILKADASGMTGGFNAAIQAMSSFKNTASVASGGLKEVEGSTKNAGGVLGAMGGIAGTVAIAVAAVGVAAIGVGIKATKMAADYQQSMNKVQALTGASTDQMSQFDSGLKQLSMETGVVPKQLADGLYNVISAGYKGKDAMTVLALATKDSVIGMTNATVTTDALTNVLASFGMGAKDANRVNGEMLDTVTLGKSTFEQYANSIVKSASSANQFHESMETMNAAFATMTSSGIRAAQASTDFQSSLKVMDGNIGAVVKSLDKNGIAFDQAKFNAMDYGHKIVYLNDALDQANQKHVHITGVTIQAAQAISTIAKHIDTYNTDLTELSNKQAMAAKTQEAWAITQQGFNVSMGRLKATAQVVMIDLGQKLLPIATGGVNLLNNAFQGLMGMGGKASDAIKAFGATLDHVGIKGAIANFEYLKKQLGDVFNTVSTFGKYAFEQLMPPMTKASDLSAKVSTDIRKLGDWFWDTGVKVKNFENSLLGSGPAVENIVDGIKQAGGAFSQLGPPLKNILSLQWDQFKTVLKDVGQDAKQVGDWFMSSVVPAFKQAAPGFANLGMTMLTTVIPAFIQIRSVVIDVLQNAFEKFAPIIEKIVPPLIVFAGIIANNLGNAIKFLTPYILQAVTAIGGFANEIIDRLQPIILGAIKAIQPAMANFSHFWSLIWGGISQALKGVWEEIAGIIKIAWAIVTGIIKIGLDLISGNWSQAWTDLKDMLKGVWDGIKTMIHGAIDVISGIFDSVWSVLSDKVSAPFASAWDFISGIFDKIKGAINWVTGQGNTVSNAASSKLKGGGAVGSFASGVENFGGGLAYVHANEMLVNLPKGASVWNREKTSAVMSTAKSTFQYPTAGAGAGGMQPVIHVHVHPVLQSPEIYLDNRKVTDAVAARMADKTRMAGVRGH